MSCDEIKVSKDLNVTEKEVTKAEGEDPGFRKPDDKNLEKLEEAKLRSKYGPALMKPGGSVFLQKKLQKRQKYFDSGDYNMEKSKGKARVFGPQPGGTGGVIPTPDSLPTRKPSIVQSKLATGMS